MGIWATIFSTFLEKSYFNNIWYVFKKINEREITKIWKKFKRIELLSQLYTFTGQVQSTFKSSEPEYMSKIF